MQREGVGISRGPSSSFRALPAKLKLPPCPSRRRTQKSGAVSKQTCRRPWWWQTTSSARPSRSCAQPSGGCWRRRRRAPGCRRSWRRRKEPAGIGGWGAPALPHSGAKRTWRTGFGPRAAHSTPILVGTLVLFLSLSLMYLPWQVLSPSAQNCLPALFVLCAMLAPCFPSPNPW